MTTKEIITLQFGHYSNFIGTHWWNIQESTFVYPGNSNVSEVKEVNHDVLFREGRTLQGDVTYTPRLISVDLKGCLGTLKKHGALYDTGLEEEVKWPGDVTLHKADRPPKNKFLADLEEDELGELVADSKLDEDALKTNPTISTKGSDQAQKDDMFGPKFYNLDDSVTVWSDFLRPYFHPKTLNIVGEYLHDNENALFDVFGQGASLMVQNSSFQEEWESNLHFFAEECDQLQGFHVLLDQHNGFGGLGWRALTYLEDEFAHKVRMVFASTPAICPDSTPTQRACRILSSGLCLQHCSALSSLYVPLSLASSTWPAMGPPRVLPHLNYKADLPYHTSAILAASLDTATLPYRKENSPCAIWDVTGPLSCLGRKVVSLDSSLPFPLASNAGFVDVLMEQGDISPCIPLTPHVSNTTPPYLQSVVTRGIPPSRVKSMSPAKVPHLSPHCNTVEAVLEVYFADVFPNTSSKSHVLNNPVKTVAPFPHIFHKQVSCSGVLGPAERPPSTGVESVPMMTALQSTPDLRDLLSSLHSAMDKFHIRRQPRFLEHGLEEDEFLETVQGLQSMADSYSQSS